MWENEFDRTAIERAARSAGDFELELTRARRAPSTRRLLASVGAAALLCAGLALSAGATTIGTHVEGSTLDATTQVAPAPAPTTDTTTTDTSTTDPATTDPATTETPATESPTTEAATTAAPATDAVETDAVTTNAVTSAPLATAVTTVDTVTTTGSAPDAVAAAAPAPVTVPAPPASRRVTNASLHDTEEKEPRRTPPPVPLTRADPTPDVPVVPPAPAFVPATPFDVQAWESSNPGSSLGRTAVAIAEHYVGTPYVWGGASPAAGFDCSGLAQYVYAQLGVALPHYAASQYALFPHLEPSQLEPGDLVFFEPRLDGPGHVAVYAGGDLIVEAPHTGALVRIGSLSGDAAALGFVGAVRPYATDPLTTLAAAVAGPARNAYAAVAHVLFAG